MLVDSKSSRLIPGLRGIPAVMTTISDPLLGRIEGVGVAGERIEDERHPVPALEVLQVEAPGNLGQDLRRSERARDEQRRGDDARPS